MNAPTLGHVIAGSLKDGVSIKLNPDVSIEQMAVGTYITIAGDNATFFSLVTDIRLDALDTRSLVNPPDISDPLIRRIWHGTGIYGVLEVLPLLAIPNDLPGELGEAKPVKSIPAHFATARAATVDDVSRVFGEEGGSRFRVGTPIDMDVPICLDLVRLAERSVGIFGKSGTGKTFLTRLLLAGLIQAKTASCLIFDMHNDHGWAGQAEGDARTVKGLKQLYPNVRIYTVDADNSRRRNSKYDREISIGYPQIRPSDIELLAEALDMRQAQIDAAYLLHGRYKDKWLATLLDARTSEERMELLGSGNSNQQALDALWRKLEKLSGFEFLKRESPDDFVSALVNDLERGNHVVLEFGRYNNSLAYVLVANLITKRIHERWRHAKETANGDRALEPPQLVIAIEEAHKFLSPQVASDTIFGEIAREMRKYNVTLLVVDQRPSAIDDEVLSQVGTRICCLLDNEKDIDAVLAGTSGRSELRTVLAKLETKQQALIFGHAVPMPIVVRTRDYGSTESYNELRVPTALEAFGAVRDLVSDHNNSFDPDSREAKRKQAADFRRLLGD